MIMKYIVHTLLLLSQIHPSSTKNKTWSNIDPKFEIPDVTGRNSLPVEYLNCKIAAIYPTRGLIKEVDQSF